MQYYFVRLSRLYFELYWVEFLILNCSIDILNRIVMWSIFSFCIPKTYELYHMTIFLYREDRRSWKCREKSWWYECLIMKCFYSCNGCNLAQVCLGFICLSLSGYHHTVYFSLCLDLIISARVWNKDDNTFILEFI